MQKVRDIYGNTIVVTDLAAAIRQCEDCMDSPFIMEKGCTVGAYHKHLLRQLIVLRDGQDKAGR